MIGINGGEFLIVAAIAAVVIGPQRLPHYASQFATLVRKGRSFASDAREKVREEMGEEFNNVDWRQLDPREYDPRRIVRQALAEEPAPMQAVPQQSVESQVPSIDLTRRTHVGPRTTAAPVDLEAT